MTSCRFALLAAAFVGLSASPAAAQERYYLWVFSSQSEPKLPKYTHTWATFARLGCCNGQRTAEAFTISWMPATLNIRTYALFSEPGVNLDLPTTLRFVWSEGERISVWGPYAISADLYGRALAQKRRLESGEVRYRTIDPLIRNLDISDCVHAVSDIAPGQSRLNYIETVFFGEAAGRRIAHAFRRQGLTCPAQEDLRSLEQALGMHGYPIIRREEMKTFLLRRTWFVALCAWPLAPAAAFASDEPPALRREFRGVWVAAVANIDWPSKKGLTTEQQQAELLAILDKAAALRLNAVILQVRPMCDALYASKLEPWSEYLTDTLGKPPEPFYDPLAFAVRAAHVRGLELHAWFNPYRARHPSATGPVPDDHLVKARPDLARPYGKHHWLVPTRAEVQDHSLRVILDVVCRYDIDGVHIDDYFYPYKEKDAQGAVIPFPDDDSWADYQQAGGKLGRDDWRRSAVNQFVQRMYREVKSAKAWVKVGISPFGIWRPGQPPGISGLDQYAELYADARLWLHEGWCDYLSPQLYWPIRQEKQSYTKLLAWWAEQNRKGRHLWPGNFTSRVTGQDKGWPAREIVEQVQLTRAQDGATGNVHFSARALVHDTGGIAAALAPVYAEPALVPAMPWAGLKPPARPQLAWHDDAGKRVLKIQPAAPVRLYVVRGFKDGKWSAELCPAAEGGGAVVSFAALPEHVVVSAIDRAGTESPPALLAR